GNIKDFSIASQINLEKLEEEYKNLAREIIAELENYYNDFNEQDITTATSADALLAATSSEHNVAENDNSEIIIAASNLRERLIELKVPKNYKELHLKIALSIDKLEAYCGSSDSSDRLDGLEILEQIRLDYSWL
ncbi:MAG: hypothetical protein U9R06_01815, partial [Patescibacteria group bacterium]|nr:hypothetical protein [Patescibacteria group bacterium]